MQNLFDIVGDHFFRPLTSSLKIIYVDTLKIIYDTYRTELSYGAEREILLTKLSDYFERYANSDIQFEDEDEILRDARSKATVFLRKLKEYGWIEYEYTNDNTQHIVMPNHAVTFLQTFEAVTSQNEMEYQSEISAIYSLLTNEDLLNRPYPQILKPVYERTMALFTGLKKLNTSIRKYIDELTSEKTSDEILHDFFEYHDEIGSKAYHRIKTSENISRFRNTIIARLNDFRTDENCMEKMIAGYQNIENEQDKSIATEKVQHMVSEIIDHFRSYDYIVEEIDQKHTKYIRNAVERAKFLLINTNNMEGKLSTILQYLSEFYNREEQNNLLDDAGDDICSLFNLFPQGFISGESLKSIAITKSITQIDDLYSPIELTDEERERRRMIIYEKNKNRFSRKNIMNYVSGLLAEKNHLLATDIPIETKRDMIRVIFIALYSRTPNSDYVIHTHDQWIEINGFRFRNFTIQRKAK